MESQLLIQNISSETKGECYEISADVGFQRLWFRVPREFEPNDKDASCFVVSLLLPAMFLGRDIVVDKKYFISQALFESFDEIQTIYHVWNPSFQKISIHAQVSSTQSGHEYVGSFFSGGVDGTYTMMKHKNDIDYLILINGFDFGMGNKTWRAMVERNQNFVKNFDKKLLAIETNFKTFILNYGIARVVNFGAQLAAIGMLLGFKKYYLSGATTYSQIKPDGSHPLVDSLWNTEHCRFVHTGLEADRSKKITFLKRFPYALSHLWVCWKDPKGNCGNCSKCIRTYVALLLNDASDAILFKQPININKLKNISINNDYDFNYFSNFRELAIKRGEKQIEKILNKMLFKYIAKQFILDCDKYLFNSWFTQKKRREAGVEDTKVKVSIEERYSDEINRQRIAQFQSMSEISENNCVIGSVYFQDSSLDEDTKGEVPIS